MFSLTNILLFYLIISSCLDITLCQFAEEDYPSVAAAVLNHGYQEETHVVKSKTGYLTTLHRIPHRINHNVTNGTQHSGKPVVVLYHGLAESSIHWLVLGPSNSLAYMLVEEGFDVWLANLRGNPYSIKHESKSMNWKDKPYWDFSFHEMGDEDLIATIDYILSSTGQKNMNMIGYNLGNAVIYAGLALHPEYSDKVKLIISLAPLAFINHARTPWANAAKEPAMSLFLELLKGTFGITTYPISNSSIVFYQSIFRQFCEKDFQNTPICKHLSYIGIDSPISEGSPTKGVYAPPTVSSFKTIIHLAQIASGHRFQLFDYRLKNLEKYSTLRPPNYKIYSIKVPIALLTAANDIFSDPEDIQTLAGLLPNVYAMYNVPSLNFTHKDFIHSHQAAELVYQECIRLIKHCQSDTLCVHRND